MSVKKKTTSKTKRKVEQKKIGRPLGAINKKDVQKHSLLEYAREIGKAPAELMLEVANGLQPYKDHVFSAQEMLQAAKDVAPYCHPKLRSTEIKGEMIPATFIIKSA